MPKKKHYHQVRGSCLTCRERRIRCDTSRPICQNCNRLSRKCRWTFPESEHIDIKLQDSRLLELELMHHYSAYTYATISLDPKLIVLWKDVVPKYALKHEFLLKGILALAACHKAHSNPRTEEHLLLAVDEYQQNALSLYVKELDNITEHNCHALFCFSQAVVGIFYFRGVLSSCEAGTDPYLILDRLLEAFGMLKGALLVAKHASYWLNAGDLRDMMADEPLSDTNSLNLPHNQWSTALQALTTRIHDAEVVRRSERDVKSLLTTITLLLSAFSRDERAVDQLNFVVALPMWFDDEYLVLLKSKDDVALVLLAFYAVLLHRHKSFWFLDKIGSQVIQAVSQTVGQDWHPYLALPIATVCA